jgi:putative endonuclease
LLPYAIFSPQTDPDHNSGRLGEKAACVFLRKSGYKVLVRNYPSRWGEIDIVCRHQNTLVFVEVKTRGENSWGTPAAAVTRSKQRRLILTAHAYLKELEDKDIRCRFDVVEVYLSPDQPPHCELIQAAFELPDIP